MLVLKLSDPRTVVDQDSFPDSVISLDVCGDQIIVATTNSIRLYRFDGTSLSLIAMKESIAPTDVAFLKPSCDVIAVTDIRGTLLLFDPQLRLLYDKEVDALSVASQWGKLYVLDGSRVYEYVLEFAPAVLITTTATTTTYETIYTSTNTTVTTTFTTTYTTSTIQTLTTTVITQTSTITTTTYTRTISMAIPLPLLAVLLPKLVVDRAKRYLDAREH
ncbi:MAG: hypothetical protein GXO07_03710 [Crenarchaeota archaeon]|nr:hypothetical protein [Thermoproteota archaeon]